MRKVKKENEINAQFPVVGIGASAGGLDAVSRFLRALPAKTGMAFVFVQHLSPKHESILPEILKKIAPFPVSQITDNIHLEPDHLYIIPENKVVTATDGILKLAPLNKKGPNSNTIDLFFSSLGVVHQSYAIGVVLSGALHDGTLGLQVIKSYGGLTFAQDEASAAYDSMPNSAVKAGVVDFILSPEKIAEHLVTVNYPFHTGYLGSNEPGTTPEHDNDNFKQILTVLRVRRGVDFSWYKQSTLKRRIIRRMALNKIEKPLDYLIFLRENKTEQDALYNDMLISVTSFFRDPQSFDLLCKSIFPALTAKKTYNDPLRIWVAGCATGEEAYSLAICIQEELGDKAAAVKIQVFATDISEIAIAKARMGIYRPNEVEGVSASRLQQFFTKANGHYQVSKIIRDMCVFAHHNLLKDPPFSKIDLVSCRNVMIYLEPVLQKRALTTFHYSLNDGGYLMLGKSETIGNCTDIFSNVNITEKIYQRKGPIGRFAALSSAGREQTFRNIDQNIQKESSNKDIFKIADEIILANFMPASVLVNEKFDIVQFRGVTETWLVPPTGKPNFNILKMAREGLTFELRNILHHAKKTDTIAGKSAVFFKHNGIQHFVNMQAVPLKDTAEPYYLIVFQPASANGAPQTAVVTAPAAQNITYGDSEARIDLLEKELSQARADMRAITEEQETANEELQSANEELLSGSEELQSLNEELETSKEELQSTNEEIMIVNKELLDRNDQLNSAQLYTEGVVNTIRDSLLILDKDFRIKRATGGFYEKFHLTEKETEGQYIFELNKHEWNIPGLKEMLEEVLPAKKVLADVEVSQAFSSIGERVLLINAREIDKINGEKLILMAIEDVTDKRKVEAGLAIVEQMLSESRERLRFAVEAAGLGTWDFDPQTNELIWDKRSREIYGVLQSSAVNLSVFFELIHADDRERVQDDVKKALSGTGSGDYDVEYRTVVIDEKTKWLKSKGHAYFNDQGNAIRFIGTLLDITIQKLVDEATMDLLRKKDEFISIASHELRTPVTSLKAALQMLERIAPQNDAVKPAHVFISKALKQVDKLTDLIRDLLDVTKMQSGKLELNKSKFMLDELLDECRGDLQSISQKHRIILECGHAIEIYADRNRLEQVIVNLVSNAIKYSPGQDQVIIKVSKSAGEVNIRVTDFGIGIAAEKLPFLFDRFYRVNIGSLKYSGLGLGLYISSEIVKQHDGQIYVESEPDNGSSFWFNIPQPALEIGKKKSEVLA